MSKLKFVGMAAALLLLAGCTVPLGLPGGYGGYGGYGGCGGYGGYGGYDAYGGNGYGAYPGSSPYGYSYPAPQYGYSNGYSGGTPYYGYPSGPVASGPPVVIDNQIPTPYAGVNSTDPTRSGRESPYWSRHANRHNRRYHRNGNNQEDPSATDPTGRTRAGLNGRQGQWSNRANRQGSQFPQQQGMWGNQRNRQGSQFSQRQAYQQGQLANSRGFSSGQRSQMANQQRRMRAPMARQTMSRPMVRQSRGPTMAARRPMGNTAMRSTRTAPRAQQSGNNQRRVRRRSR